MHEPIDLAGYRRVRAVERRKHAARFPDAAPADVEALSKWATRYILAHLEGRPLPPDPSIDLVLRVTGRYARPHG